MQTQIQKLKDELVDGPTKNEERIRYLCHMSIRILEGFSEAIKDREKLAIKEIEEFH